MVLMVEKLSGEEIRIPVIQTKIEEKQALLNEEGNVIQEAQQAQETCWLATTIPPEPLKIRKRGGSKEFPFKVSASVGKKA